MKWISYHVVSYTIAVVALAVILSMVGCSKKATRIDIAPDTKTVEYAAPDTKPVVVPEDKPVVMDMATVLEPVTIYFDFESDRLRPEEAMKLDAFIGKKCRLVCRACEWGTDAYNLGLSERRGRMVQMYIGVNCDIEARGELDSPDDCGTVDAWECAKWRHVEVIP